MSLATHHYHADHGHLPIGCDYLLKQHFGPNPIKGSVGLSWHTSILPYIEQEALWRAAWQAHKNAPRGDTPEHDVVLRHVVRTFLCASDANPLVYNYRGEAAAMNDYVGVAGSGVAHNDGIFHADFVVTLASITDGTSNTVMIGERPAMVNGESSGWYSQWGRAPCRIAQIHSTQYFFDYAGAGGCSNDRRPLRPSTLGSPCGRVHFWSIHPGGANFAFADGSVRFIKYEQGDILEWLATRAGGETVSDDMYQ